MQKRADRLWQDNHCLMKTLVQQWGARHAKTTRKENYCSHHEHDEANQEPHQAGQDDDGDKDEGEKADDMEVDHWESRSCLGIWCLSFFRASKVWWQTHLMWLDPELRNCMFKQNTSHAEKKAIVKVQHKKTLQHLYLIYIGSWKEKFTVISSIINGKQRRSGAHIAYRINWGAKLFTQLNAQIITMLYKIQAAWSSEDP